MEFGLHFLKAFYQKAWFLDPVAILQVPKSADTYRMSRRFHTLRILNSMPWSGVYLPYPPNAPRGLPGPSSSMASRRTTDGALILNPAFSAFLLILTASKTPSKISVKRRAQKSAKIRGGGFLDFGAGNELSVVLLALGTTKTVRKNCMKVIKIYINEGFRAPGEALLARGWLKLPPGSREKIPKTN